MDAYQGRGIYFFERWGGLRRYSRAALLGILAARLAMRFRIRSPPKAPDAVRKIEAGSGVAWSVTPSRKR
jgi:hypothetical protein